jgi:dUTP pyrophosphatase
MKVKIVNKSGFELPKYETILSAGMDLKARITEGKTTLEPMERKMIPTGIFIELPDGYEAQVRPRSGLAIKKGISVINTPGTVDPDYRGEVCVLLVNLSKEPFDIFNGDRIAQMVIGRFERIEWEEVEILSETVRGTGGFQSTGIKSVPPPPSPPPSRLLKEGSEPPKPTS